MVLDASGPGLLLRRLFQIGRSAKVQEGTDEPIIGWTAKKEPIRWPRPTPEAAAHTLILGSSGCGKSTLIAAATIDEMIKESKRPLEERMAHCVIDPKGDVASLTLAGLAASPLLDKLNFLNPFSPTAAPPFNLNRLALDGPIEIRAMAISELIAKASTQRGGAKWLSTGSRQQDLIFHLVLAALTCPHPRAHLLLALDALNDKKDGLVRLALATSSERARTVLFSLAKGGLSDELRVSCSSRIRSTAMTSDLEKMLCAPSCVQWDDLLSPGALTIIHLGDPPGGMASLQEYYANTYTRLLFQHLLSRPSPWPGHHCRIILDEAQIVVSSIADILETILCTGRSRGISLSSITQTPVKIFEESKTMLRTLFTNSSKIIGRLSAADAEIIVKEATPKAGIDETVAAVRTRMMSSICNLPDREFYYLTPGQHQRFRSADVDMEKWQQTAAEHANEIEAVKNRLGLPPDMPPRVRLEEIVDLPPKKRGRRSGRKTTSAPRKRGGGTAPPAPPSPIRRQTAPRPANAAKATPVAGADGNKEKGKEKNKPQSRWG